MNSSVKSVACFVATLCPLTIAQDAAQLGASMSKASNSPVAYVYVSSSPRSNKFQINAYSAASNGALTAVVGSPFVEGGAYMASNGKWLFSTDTIKIYSFSVASDGGLKRVSTINAQELNGYSNGGPLNLFLDRTGSTLYDEDIYGNEEANNTYQFFDINQLTGALNYAGATSVATPEFETPLSFIANNEYAYGASCYHSYITIYGFSRASNGTLDDLNLNPSIPASSQGAYCPYLAAADPTGHVAITLTPTDEFTVLGPTQLGVFTACENGDLTTTNTDADMPAVAVGTVNDISVSPSGKLLAVTGSNGLQVFHFDGANPITKYTGVLTSDFITQAFWDSNNHLYAISPSAGKLYVYTVTPTSHSQAPGSPYAITNPQDIIVLPE
jgi:hypothetical protein